MIYFKIKVCSHLLFNYTTHNGGDCCMEKLFFKLTVVREHSIITSCIFMWLVIFLSKEISLLINLADR